MITENVKLYYGDSGNEKFVTEERQLSYREGEDKYRIVLEELVEGPENEDFNANISPDTRVYGTIRQNTDLIVGLSEEFASFGGSVAEIIGVGSVVNTLTQFDEIKRVKILVEGNELVGPSGEPRGFMAPFAVEVVPPATAMEVTLYFATPDAVRVVPEKRSIEIPANASREQILKLVLEELVAGPQQQDLSRTIPPEVRILSVEVVDDTAKVDFSEEMESRHWGGATGEAITINSIANTLTEFDYVQQVLMTVAGRPMNIEHVVLDVPVGRNEEMIQN
jgi:germination protein M